MAKDKLEVFGPIKNHALESGDTFGAHDDFPYMDFGANVGWDW